LRKRHTFGEGIVEWAIWRWYNLGIRK